MPTEVDERREEEDIPLWTVELGCWTMVVLTPVLTWVNGPPVSTDQAVVRTVVFWLAVAGGVTLRVVRWRCAKREKRSVEDGLNQDRP